MEFCFSIIWLMGFFGLVPLIALVNLTYIVIYLSILTNMTVEFEPIWQGESDTYKTKLLYTSLLGWK